MKNLDYVVVKGLKILLLPIMIIPIMLMEGRDWRLMIKEWIND